MDPADSFGLSPTMEEVEKWFLSLGYQRHIVGKSLLGRDLVAFSRQFVDESSALLTHQSPANVTFARPPPTSTATKDRSHRTVLFQSLVHGNEPLGLLALLHTAAALSSGSSLHRVKKLLHASQHVSSLELVFFPVVNIDAYQLNLDVFQRNGQWGCRRTNMRVSVTGSFLRSFDSRRSTSHLKRLSSAPHRKYAPQSQKTRQGRVRTYRVRESTSIGTFQQTSSRQIFK